MKIFKKLLTNFVFALNLLAIIWLLICRGVALYDPAGHPTLFSLFSFSTIFALFINLFFILFWLFTKHRFRSLWSLGVILLMWNFLQPLVGINYFSKNQLKDSDGNLKIMTWNVHLFDLGAWTNDESSKARIIDLINEESPDVLCLQEFYQDKKNSTLPYTEVIRNLGYPYVAFAEEYTIPKRVLTIHASSTDQIQVGNIVFSKMPLMNTQIYPLGVAHYNLLNTQVMVDSNRMVDLNVVHLTSVQFGAKEKEIINAIQEEGVSKSKVQRSKTLIRKLEYAAAQRAILANQIDSLKRFMDYPMIICGDFNDIPGSYVYQTIRGDQLTDPFIKKGVGLGRTFREISPTLRIDHVLVDREAFEVIGYGRLIVPLSDHYPVIVNLNDNRKPKGQDQETLSSD